MHGFYYPIIEKSSNVLRRLIFYLIMLSMVQEGVERPLRHLTMLSESPSSHILETPLSLANLVAWRVAMASATWLVLTIPY